MPQVHFVVSSLHVPVKLLQSCLTFCYPMDCGPPGSSVHGILQARILEWIIMPSSRGSSQEWKPSSHMAPALAGWFFITSATWEAQVNKQPRTRLRNIHSETDQPSHLSFSSSYTHTHTHTHTHTQKILANLYFRQIAFQQIDLKCHPLK